MSELLPGEFAIRCFDNPPDSPSYVSWADVGPNQPFLDTAPDTVSGTELFRFTAYTPEFTFIQAGNGQYVTVPPGGGLILTDGPEEGSPFVLIGPQRIENKWGGRAARSASASIFGLDMAPSSPPSIGAASAAQALFLPMSRLRRTGRCS